jgi:hypothetical protein
MACEHAAMVLGAAWLVVIAPAEQRKPERSPFDPATCPAQTSDLPTSSVYEHDDERLGHSSLVVV